MDDMPPGLEFKTPAAYGYDKLKKLTDNTENIKFILKFICSLVFLLLSDIIT